MQVGLLTVFWWTHALASPPAQRANDQVVHAERKIKTSKSPSENLVKAAQPLHAEHNREVPKVATAESHSVKDALPHRQKSPGVQPVHAEHKKEVPKVAKDAPPHRQKSGVPAATQPVHAEHKKDVPKGASTESLKDAPLHQQKSQTPVVKPVHAEHKKKVPKVAATESAKDDLQKRPTPAAKSAAPEKKKDEESEAIGRLVNGLAAVPTTRDGKPVPRFANGVNHLALRALHSKSKANEAKPIHTAKPAQHPALVSRAYPSILPKHHRHTHPTENRESSTSAFSVMHSAETEEERAAKVQRAMDESEKAVEEVDTEIEAGKKEAVEAHRIAHGM